VLKTLGNPKSMKHEEKLKPLKSEKRHGYASEKMVTRQEVQ